MYPYKANLINDMNCFSIDPEISLQQLQHMPLYLEIYKPN